MLPTSITSFHLTFYLAPALFPRYGYFSCESSRISPTTKFLFGPPCNYDKVSEFCFFASCIDQQSIYAADYPGQMSKFPIGTFSFVTLDEYSRKNSRNLLDVFFLLQILLVFFYFYFFIFIYLFIYFKTTRCWQRFNSRNVALGLTAKHIRNH